MSDRHTNLLRRVARGWRRRADAEQPDGPVGAARQQDAEQSAALAAARLAAAEVRRRPPVPPTAPAPGDGPPLVELEAIARHADQQLALYRRRIYLGRGEPRRLAELERIADGAGKRARRARGASAP
jgi:hypothetical protein